MSSTIDDSKVLPEQIEKLPEIPIVSIKSDPDGRKKPRSEAQKAAFARAQMQQKANREEGKRARINQPVIVTRDPERRTSRSESDDEDSTRNWCFPSSAKKYFALAVLGIACSYVKNWRELQVAPSEKKPVAACIPVVIAQCEKVTDQPAATSCTTSSDPFHGCLA